MYYLVGKNANIGRRIVTENHPDVQMHIKEAIELGVTPRVPEEIIKWMWGIEKKSDNVFDLIEVGDLIECANYHFTYVNEVIDIEADVMFRGVENLVLSYNILAIYKPNSKGDYIKVWECEQ